jgi:hypothetical protein
VVTLIGWYIGQNTYQSYSILIFYSLQVGLYLLLAGSILSISIAIKKHAVHNLSSYILLFMFITYGFGVFISSHLIITRYAIPTKITNPDNRIWSEAMVGRALGGWTSGACTLGDNDGVGVAVLMGVWSFVTPDGRMPALTFASAGNLIPDAGLRGNPTACTKLQANWYFCYLNKPYQLVGHCP